MNARKGRKEELEPQAKHPRYTCGLLWDNKNDVLSASTQYLLTAVPVPCVPTEESSNEALMETIHANGLIYSKSIAS
jgi:hypothetical protein